MEKMLLVTVFTLLSLLNAACLGDNPGEVYFNAYTKDGSGHYTVDALYKTTNYGQTATLVAENFNATIFKDKTPGVFYKIPLGSLSLYISQDTCRTWQWQSVIQSTSFQTGVFPGECFDASNLSQDYGKTWTFKPWNGIPGEVYSSCLGLVPGEMYAYPYNQKLYRSTDYGDNFTMINDTLNFGQGGVWHGWQPGELFIGRSSDYKIFRSFDHGQTYNYLYQIPEYFRTVYWMTGLQPNEEICYSIKRYPYMVLSEMEIKFYKTTDWYQTIDSVTTNYNVGIVENGEWRISQLPQSI